MAFRSFLFLLLLLGLFSTSQAKGLLVIAPNTLRLNSNENIAAVYDNNGEFAFASAVIHDFPGKSKIIFSTQFLLTPGKPMVFTVHLKSTDFPVGFLNAPGSQKSVVLSVIARSFKRQIIIPISAQSGYVFIQTDKPIYTPKQKARMRIISLNEEARPSNEDLKLQIKNPNGNIVEEKVIIPKNDKEKKSFVSHIYQFPEYPVLGKWSATVLYGYKFQQNSTVHFELEEYVLPTFTATLKTQGVILPSTETIKINVLAKYVYGEKVKGIVTFRVGVKREKSDVIFLDAIGPTELEDGASELILWTKDLKNHENIGWFPGIKGSRLVVEATVVDEANGQKEVAMDTKGRFTTSPLSISFKRCLKDFRPGYTTIFEADVTFADGTPAAGVSTTIKALADIMPVNIAQYTAVSDENGKIGFEIQTELSHSTIFVTIETNDPRYVGNQASGIFLQQRSGAPDLPYIALTRGIRQRLKPGDIFTRTIHFEPIFIGDIYCMVIARGRILLMDKLPPGKYKTQTVEFEITSEMVPSFRVVVFANFQGNLIADSLKIEVERECNSKAQVSIVPEFSVKEPGSDGKFIIQGTKGTLVGLLGVDEAVYALSKQDLLTKSKIFNNLETHDLGCGAGGGMYGNVVLEAAGISVDANESPLWAHPCSEMEKYKKAASGIVSTTGINRMCCSLGKEKDKRNRNCQERTNIVKRYLNGQYDTCPNAFLDCCNIAEAQRAPKKVPKQETSTPTFWQILFGIFLPSTPIMTVGMSRPPDIHISEDRVILPDVQFNFNEFDLYEPDFIETTEDEEFFEQDLTVRSDFRETWIFEDILIGENNTEQFPARLPHSITTWVIQAVSVSPSYGICVAEPQKMVSFQKVFLQLNLPYSVIRNEQVEIQATVFNYGNKRIRAIMYMYGVKDLCTGRQPGEKSERKRLLINAQSAASASFPVIPLKAADFPIKVVVLTPEGGDVIQKTLHVVHEGVSKEISIPIKLDPTNQQQRFKEHIETEYYSDTIDHFQNLQNTAIKLGVPEAFVPGTESCSVAALGDLFGTVIETSINNPENLFQEPGGCGEQNMMRLAPTLYTMRYLKLTGRLTTTMEEKGFGFIQKGYNNQMKFRKKDGSYSTFPHTNTCTWLTAFVMKVFCQSNELVRIDNDVLCSGVRWLINNQEPDGSYIEKTPVLMKNIMGGIQGKTPLTAFILIALTECKCEEEKLFMAKQKAAAYLENHLQDVNTPLPTAIVAYALALSGSDLKQTANDKLLSMAEIDEDTNTMYWTTPDAAQDIQTAAYGLLTQLLFSDLSRSNAIVNWLNAKQLHSGSFKSTQDTVIALQALSEYAINAKMPPMNLVVNISSSNDINFKEVLTFNEENALILQSIKIDKIGGTLFVNTSGQGMGSLAVKCRYNLVVPPEEICKFDVGITVTDTKTEKEETEDMVNKSSESSKKGSPQALSIERVKRQNSAQNDKTKFKISLCIRYLDNEEAGMSIVDVGIFSGFEPILQDLQKLQDDRNHLIQRYEKSGRGVVFYLEKIPWNDDYCFSFHVYQEYLVANTQTSGIKVYDYYNPDATCTKFYSLSSSTSQVQTICEDGICECAEDDCPPKFQFSSIYTERDVEERRKNLKRIVCDKYDYVWKGQLYGPIKKEGGFMNMSFLVEEVSKEGIEKRNQVEGKIRTLLAPHYCDETCPAHVGFTYLIFGKDGEEFRNSKGDTWYRYIIGKNTMVYQWSLHKDEERHLDMIDITKELLEKGCEM